MPTKKTNEPSAGETLKLMLQLDRGRRRWRLFAILFGIILFLSTFLPFLINQVGNTMPTNDTPLVATVKLEGLLIADAYQRERLAALAHDDNVKAVIVEIDSPGGTMVGGLEIYEQLSLISANKPVVAVMGTIAASAGYLVALGADEIIASPATLTGSIGVLMPLVDASELASRLGIKPDEVTSGDFKASTSPLKSRDAAEREYLQGMVDSLQKIFLDVVIERRTLSEAALTQIQDGRAVTGAQAHNLGLIDHLGSIETANDWLAETHNIGQDVKRIEYSLEQPHEWLHELIGQATLLTQWSRLHQPAAMGVWAVAE